jgi:glycosyltransferase involved in cell wall biosynthesis
VLPSFSIVIPAFNEAASIGASVRDALEVGVCDDGSRDDTAAIAGAVAARDRRVIVLRRPVNRGIEASMRALYAQAGHAWVFLNSADRQWPMAVLGPMTAAAGAHFVIVGMYCTDQDMGGQPDAPRGDGVYRPVLARGDGAWTSLAVGAVLKL